MKHFDIDMEGVRFSDSSAALGIIKRKGLGKTRHIQTAYLWVQDVSEDRRLEYQQVAGVQNCADLMTKPSTR